MQEREKQIEEMAKDLCQNGGVCCLQEWNDCHLDVGEYCHKCNTVAERLYTAGYRKQEWISVDERLPEDTQMCLAYATVYFVPDHVDDCDHCERIIVTKYYKEFGFMDWDVHYWMPLPEAPKMKGGAE